MKKFISTILGVLIIFFVMAIIAGISMSNTLKKYPWGEDVEKILNDIGVKSVRNATLTGDFEDKQIYILDADDIELKLWLNKNEDESFEIMQISSNGRFDKYPEDAIFYINDKIKTDDIGRVLYDIYDYSTGNIVLSMDEGIKEEKRKKIQAYNEENEYKEMWYDDIFFGEEDITGTKVKLNLFLEEDCFFTMNALYNSQITEFCNENNVSREFYKCGVLKENENNYAGEQIDLFFSDDYTLNPNDYKTGDKIVVEGEIVQYYVDEWDGHNNVIIIPHSIEIE